MRNSGRHLVLLTLSGVLLVNLGLSKADGELVKQDSPLPALVPIEDESPVSASAPRTTTSETTIASLPTKITTDSPTSSTSSPDVKETNRSGQEEQSDSGKDKTVQPVKESSDSTAAFAEDGGSSQRKAPAAGDESSTSEKDIRVLLATKNDAENDLNSPSVVQDKPSPASPPVVVAARTDRKELDSPVDINGNGESGKPQVETYDNRFHYSLAGSADKPLAGSDSTEQPTTTTTTKQPPKPDEPKEGTEDVSNSEKPADGAQKETEPSKGASPDTLAGKKIDEKVKPVAIDPVPETKPDPVPADRLSPSDEKEKPNSEVQPTITTTTSTQAPESSTSLPAVQPSSSDAGVSTTQDKAKDATPKEPESAPKAKPQVPEESPKSEADEAKNTTLVSAQPKKPADATDKSVSVPSILAVALGTALGGAVNPLLKTQNRDKPVVPNPAVAATRNLTTKAPSTTTRKSSTDKWDRWQPTTGAPPTRLRPILPSIRRRFRPYNRFSPFPFGGPDSYSPLDTDFPSHGDPSIGQGAGRRSPVPPSPSTSRPSSRRRGSSTEPPKSTENGSSEESEEEVTSKPQDTGTRRRGQGSNRRRHHHHDHQHGPNRGEPEVAERRHYNKNHGTRQFEREDPFGSDSQSFNDGNHHRHHPRPISPGFSLFNTGSTGTGFDLLNPFSGWLDDAIKPRPPVRGPVGQSPGSTLGSPGRRPGSQPIPVEGDYNDESEHGHGHHHHNNRPHNGREDYYEHRHDCDHHHDHDHDHDHHHDHHHREPYRPGRPHREPVRPPIGGDYEPYSPSASFGRRPSRPYNRRDQTESNSNEQNGSSEQPSPGLYANIAPVAPRRVPSIFSPFDSLFGSLDDDLFSLRSSFVEGPPKAQESSHAFDTILSSPKISMPSVESRGKEGEDKANKQPDAAIKPTGEQEAINNGKQPTIADVGRRAQRAHDNNDCTGFRRGSLWCLILSI